MKMNKLPAVALAVGLVFTAPACSGSGNESVKKPASTTTTTVLGNSALSTTTERSHGPLAGQRICDALENLEASLDADSDVPYGDVQGDAKKVNTIFWEEVNGHASMTASADIMGAVATARLVGSNPSVAQPGLVKQALDTTALAVQNNC